jgi:hypothetical protein
VRGRRWPVTAGDHGLETCFRGGATRANVVSGGMVPHAEWSEGRNHRGHRDRLHRRLHVAGLSNPENDGLCDLAARRLTHARLLYRLSATALRRCPIAFSRSSRRTLSGQRIAHGEPDGQANRDQYCNVQNRCAHPMFIAHKDRGVQPKRTNDIFHNVTLITVSAANSNTAAGPIGSSCSLSRRLASFGSSRPHACSTFVSMRT